MAEGENGEILGEGGVENPTTPEGGEPETGGTEPNDIALDGAGSGKACEPVDFAIEEAGDRAAQRRASWFAALRPEGFAHAG